MNSERLNIMTLFPDVYEAVRGLEKAMGTSQIDPLQKELIKIRASQVNGCAFCLNMHARLARKYGETEHRIYLISVWKETKGIFSEEDRLLLEMTEEITLIHKHGLSAELYEKAVALFGEEKTAQVIMAIVAINTWNRLGVALEWEPEM